MKFRLNCFVLVLSDSSLILLRFYLLYLVLVVNACYLKFFLFIVLSSSPIINNVHQPSRVALLFFIGCLWNDMYVFESFLSLHHLVANLVKNVDERGRNIMCVRSLPSRFFFHLYPLCFPFLYLVTQSH